MEDKLLGLYNDFKDAGLFKDTKDYGTFKKRMQGAGYQSQIYKVAKDNGADVGQFWQFQRNFGLGRWANKGGSVQAAKSSQPNAPQSELVQAANRVAANYQAKQNNEAYKAGQGMWGVKGGTTRGNGKDWRQNHPTVAKIYDTITGIPENVEEYFNVDPAKDSAGATNERVKELKKFGDKARQEAARKASELHDSVMKSGITSLAKKDSEMTPLERSQASRLRKGMQAGVAASMAEENRRMNNPIAASRVGKKTVPTSNELLIQLGTDKARQARIKQQHMDDAAQLAYQGVGQNLGNDIFNEVDKGIEQGRQNSIDFMAGAVDDKNRMLAMQNDQIAESVFKAAQGQNSTEAIQKIVGQSVMNKVSDYFSRPEVQKNILDSSAKMNMAPEMYLQEYVMPSLMQYAKDAVSQRKLENEIPKSFWGYLAKNASNSILGMMVQLGSQTQENRQLRQQGLAVAEGAEEMPQMAGHKNADYYHAGIGSRFVGSAANMLLDSGPLGAIGAGADAAVSAGARLIARGLAKAGIKDAAKLTAREAAFKAANMTMAQKITSGLLNNVPRSALNLGGYSAITSALGQASTGEDTSLGAIAVAGIEGFKHGAETGSLFGLTGAFSRPWAQRYGINGMERTAEQRRIHAAQKLGAEAASIGAEAGTMMVADNLTSDKEISPAQFLEDGVMVLSFRLGEPKNYKYLGNALHNLTHNTSKSPITLTQDERHELMNSVSGMNMMEAFSDFNKVAKSYPRVPSYGVAYSNFMNDPEVSRSTKEKVNAALGVPSQTFKLSQRSVNDVNSKQILEYSSDGTLLSRTSYKNAEQRRAILFKQKAERDNMHVLNLIGYAKLKGRQYLDENDQITPLAAKFLNSKGYDLSKDPTETKNAGLIAGMQDERSNIHKEWIKYADAYVDALGMTDEIKKILSKEPMRRTDDEVAKIKEYRNALETQLFPDSKPNLEQAEIQGRAIAEGNNLGSEQPQTEKVLTTLLNLTQAENELAEAYNSSDNLKQGLVSLAEELGVKPKNEELTSVLDAIHSTGLTNPQIFGMLADPSGKYMVGESELEPFSRYMMALHRAQGMQKATAEAIEQNVSNFVQDWSFHGTMDGNQINGEQALLVQDSNGRTLLVGNGDVAYDPANGRPKEGIGDMLVCFDAATGKQVYINVKDTTLYRIESAADLEAFRRQQLQQINSVPYNQAAQEQAAANAAKPQPKEEVQPKETVTDGNQLGQPQQEDGFEQESLDDQMLDDVKPIGKGSFGDIYDQFKGNALGAIKLLLRKKSGEAIGALHHKDVGDIDLVWGKEGTGHSNGFGLAKLAKFHPEVLGNLQEILDSTHVTSRSKNRINLESDTHKAAIRLEWDGKKKNWLLTAFKKENASADGKTTDTSSTSLGGDTALSQTEGSPFDGKDTNISPNNNENNTSLTFKDGSAVPVDANGEPDFMQMTPEQGVEVYKQLFPKTYEAEVDNTIKMLEADLKKVQKVTPKANGVMARAKEQAEIEKAVSLAEEQLARAKEIKKAITSEKVAATVGKAEATEGANAAGNEAVEKFKNAPRLVGNKRTRTLPDGETKIHGHYEIVPAESLTPSHDAMDGYKKSAGFPVDENGRTVNDRDYEHDKAAQQNTDQMALKYNGQAIDAVPTVSDEGIVYDGNGRTMAGQKAAKEGTDGEYINDLLDNAENFGFTREQIEQSGIEHPRLVLVTDERLPYDTATFAKFNRNEKKTQSNTEQAVAKAKTLTSDEVGSIIAEIEGNGSLDAFFNNSKAINDLVKTLVSKGIIGQNEVAELMEGTDRLSPQGKELVKNLLLGSIFKPETIRMLGIDSAIKNKAIAGIRAVMDNMKLGDYSLRDEIDQAVQLLYEARQGGNKVDTLLRTPEMFGENAADRYSPISQMMALALEGKVSDFRDLLNEYNREAAAHNTGEGNVFGDTPTKEELIRDFLNYKKWVDYETRGNSEAERGNDAEGVRETKPEAQGGNGEEQADKLAGVETDAEQKIDDYIAEHYPHHNGVRARTKEEQAAYDAETEAMKNDETLKQMRKEADEAFDAAKENLPLMPKTPEPKNVIEEVAEEYKKDHPLTDEEISNTTVFDDLPDDQKQYCIDAALDYLHGEDTSAIAEAYYRNIFEKRTTKSGEIAPPSGENRTTSDKEDTTRTTNPIESIEKAAAEYNEGKVKTEKEPQSEKVQTREQLESEKEAADNEFDAFMKELKKKRDGQLNSGFIDQNLIEAAPKMFSLAAKCAYTRIKLGMFDAKEVIKDLQKRFREAFDGFDKKDVDLFYSQIMSQKWRDGDKRMSLNDWAEHYRKLSPEHQEKLVGDSKDAEDRKQKEKSFINRIQLVITLSKFKTGIVGLRKIAEDCGLKDLKDTDIQELVETAVVMRARDIAASKATSDEVKFKQIKRLYENQPSLNQRDSERIEKQQYSTPAPYAFVADMYVKGGKEIGSALEPSAGNGMLTIGLPMDKVHVNDIDEARLLNLQRQGFKNISSQDGTQPFADKDVDVVVTNPPFGSATPKDYDGYRISSLEGQMAINALESMKDDGRAAIIIGGKTEYAKNGSLMPKDKAFLGYLYSHYNVEDVINVDGSLYAKQGTSYPTRIILINGRRLDENAFPPVKDKARAETVKDYDELYKRVSDDILRGRGVDSSIRNERRNVEPELDRQGSKDSDAKGVRVRGREGGKPEDSVLPDRLHEESSVSGSDDAVAGERGTERPTEGVLFGGTAGTDRAGANAPQGERRTANADGGNGVQQSEPRGAGRNDAQRNADGASISGSGRRLAVNKKEEAKRELTSEKVNYTPKSGNPFTLQSVMPADQQEAVNKSLAKLGDADQFLVDELGYNDKDDLYKHLAAEQVDAVALAIHQAKQGSAFIIGDMTGVGKGRQAASLIRYAKKQGQIPVYFTQKAVLLSDVYRDLVDIGNPELRPFIFGSDKDFNVTDAEGNLVYKHSSDKEVERVLDYIDKNGTLPKEYDYVLTTYSQVGSGIYEYGEDGSRKERKLAKGKKFDPGALNGQKRRDAIEKVIGNGYLIMDESHTVAGESGVGNYFQHIIQKAKNVTFFSATFAKRPDNMPIYALRTAMNQGGLKASDLIDAVKRGGATLQEIMSQTLTKCGQMIRRERDMTGVTIDWKAIDEPDKVEEQRAQYDSIIGLFNDIINFQRTYVSDYVENRNKELAAIQSSMGIKRGTAALGIKNTPFASKAFNTVQQVLLSLKAKSAAERAVEYLKQGMKPVIALNNTNESQTGNLAIGEEMDAPDLGTSLKKGLEGTLRYTQKDAKDNSNSGYIKLSDLGDDAIAAYHELEKKIEQTSTGLSLSPIDVIKNELEKAGYKVGELTGRQTEFVYNDNGTVTKVKRADTDKKKLAREFNDGHIDALILNKSAATGISLHASSKYKDQRKRVMIVAQQQLDVNDEVQMRGRIDRTGQVQRGAYEYVVSLIPAEQRLLMMFKAKLKSLDANTTSSQKSKFNEMEVADITNKYGDKVVREYMAEHLDLYSRMADPFGWEKTYGDDLAFIDPQKLSYAAGGVGEAGADASKLLGRMALLKVAEQEKMLQEIGDLYAAEINRLNEMGENDLEITELPLKAKTIGKEVWKKGTEPDGDNAFADNTYIEKVNMAILKKPMKAQEVQKAQEGLTGGKSWDEYHDNKKAEVKNYFDQKIADATQKNEERAVKLATNAKEKYQKDAKRGQKDSGMSDEQIEQMAGYQYDNIYKAEKEKLNEIVKNLNAKAEVFNRVLDTFNTEDAYVLPADMNNPNEMSAFGNSYGRLIDIKITDNFSPNASSVSFATLDGRRKITFPVSGKVGAGESKADVIAAIDRMTRQASGVGDKHLRVLSMDTANWDKLVSNESRKDGYIITGNLMQALIDTKAQGVGGQLVKYTTDGGEVKTGILMPDRFEPKDVSVEAPISSVEEKFHKRLDEGGIESIKSSDGEVEIIQKYNPMKGDFDYQIRVPKSQKRGGKYFLDKELMSMMGGGNFETRGNSMLGEFKEQDLRPVLARLSNLGVKVREERPSSEEDGTHFRTDRGVQYSKTDEKDVKNSRIIPEDVDKSVSSQIEKKFDDEISSVYGRDLTPEEKSEVERIANIYRNTPVHDEYTKDENGDKQNHGGLKSAIELWDNLATNFEDYYGIERKTSQISEARQGNGLDRMSGESFSRMENGARERIRLDGRAKKIPAEEIKRYQGIITHLASAKRALAYHNERTRVLEKLYGKQSDEWLPQDVIERIFKDFNTDKNLQTLFDRIKEQVKNLDIYFGETYEGEKGTNGFYRHSFNDIRINFDELAAFGRTKQELASTILHEMLHPVTSDIIAMYQEGHTGKLTPSQIEAAKEAVDLFNEIKKTFKDNGWKEPYALTNAREFFTELSNPEWRAALKEIKNGDSWWKRALKSLAKMLGFKTSTNKLDEAEKVLDNLLSNFGKDQFDYASRHANELFKDVQSKKIEDKDELDRLNKEKTFRMYSGMQEVDGKLYSPMAAIIGGKRTDATEMGAWMKADERPDLVKNGKFTLVKTDKNKGLGEGDVDAAYNPYMHTSSSMMNDQFTGAYARGNIKVVEWEIPESEKTSGYRAEGAKDAVGLVPWHSGSVNSLLPKDRQRQVMLSQYRKAVRIVPDSDVAESIAEQLRGTGLAIPWNVVTPNQVRELAKLGVPITTVESGKQAPETKAKFEAQMEELKEEYPQAKFVDVKMTKDAFKDWGKNGGTHFRSDSAVRVAGDAPVVVKHVDQIAQKLGAKVNMVQSAEDVTNKSAKAAIERGKKITGWYDEKTGEVHLYMPNIHDRYTAEKTIWHEVVGHKGMRELFGDENYSKFLRSIWYDLDKPENARLKELVSEELKYNPFDFENGIEEGIARLVEDGKGEPGFWNAIKNKVTDILHEIGYRIAPNTKDVKYLLWLSKNLQKNPNDPYWKMKAEAVRYKLDKENVPAMIEKDGVFYTNDGKARSFNDISKKEFDEATDGVIHLRTTPSAGTALDRYHKALDAHGYMFTESYMDNMLSLKNLMQAIVPDNKNIADIKSSENPYILQNTMQGAMSNAAQMFERNVMKPLDKAMAEVLDAFEGKKDDEKIRNFNLYMITKHGLERNRILYMRDTLADMRMDEKQKKNAEVIEKDWYDELASLNEQLDRGDIDLKGYFDGIDDFIRLEVDSKFDAGEHDYSGIHAIQGVEKSSDPYDDAEAIASVMDAEANMESIKKGSVKAYWDKVKAATQYAIDTDYKNGLISKELHGYVSGMFNWYVPLRKYDEATAEDTYGYITEKGDPKNFIGSSIMRARGHKYLSETNVLAQIGAMGNRAINNGGQNAIKQAFARFIRNHSDNNLVTETSVWYVDDPVTKTTTERYPEIPEDATPDEVNQIVADFNAEMRDLESKGLATKVRRRGRIGYKFQRAENKSQHIVDVKIAGKLHSFIINGNPRAAQALNGLLEHKNTTLAGKVMAGISRFMAQTCTSFNPEFVMRNMIRDFEFASSNLLAKEGFRYTTIFEKYYAKVGLIEGIKNSKLKDFKDTGGFGLFAKYRNGTLDMNDKVQRYFKEFMENGGETGWVQVKNMKDLTKEYKANVKAERNGVVKVGKGIYDAIFKNLENVNEIAENMARFATYCASRDYGRTIVRSTYDAKEVSTNFNRHGSGGEIKSFKNGEMGAFKEGRRNFYSWSASYLRNCSMFFNAGIQSTNLLIKNFKTNPKSTAAYIAAAPFISGALMALVNNMIIAGEDEKERNGVRDPYGELPDYIRKNNLCVYIGGGEFVTIPLAIEERAFYGLGDLAAGMTFSPNIKTTRSWYAEGIGSASQLVPVLDYLGNKTVDKNPWSETLKATLPSATSPFVEWAFNSDWKGAPIERENSFDEHQPAWMRAYRGTPDFLININKKVNAATNDVAKGNEDMLGNSFLDAVTNPSGIRHYYSGFLGGAATFVERTAELIKHGKDTETKDVPFVRSLLYTPSEQTSLQRSKSKWYNYVDEMETTMANVDRLKAKNVSVDKRLTNMADYYHFQNSSDAAKVRIIELAQKQMKQWKKMRDRATDTQSVNFANQNIDRIMMEAVDELDRME